MKKMFALTLIATGIPYYPKHGPVRMKKQASIPQEKHLSQFDLEAIEKAKQKRLRKANNLT